MSTILTPEQVEKIRQRADTPAAGPVGYFRFVSAARVDVPALIASHEALRAIVATLPKTADGVPVYAGMTAWHVQPSGEIVEELVVLQYSGEERYEVSLGFPRLIGRDYSTREAAEAARKPKEPQ